MASSAFSVHYCRGSPSRRTHTCRNQKEFVDGLKETLHLLSIILPLPMVHNVSSISYESSRVLKIKLNQPKYREMSSGTYPRINGSQMSNNHIDRESKLRARYVNLPTSPQRESQIISSKPTSDSIIKCRFLLLGFHSLLVPEGLGKHDWENWARSGRPFLCRLFVRPVDHISLGSGEEVRCVLVVGRQGETVCIRVDSSGTFGNKVWWENVETNGASNGEKRSALFHRASSTAFISALTSTSIGRCWKVSLVGATLRR